MWCGGKASSRPGLTVWRFCTFPTFLPLHVLRHILDHTGGIKLRSTQWIPQGGFINLPEANLKHGPIWVTGAFVDRAGNLFASWSRIARVLENRHMTELRLRYFVFNRTEVVDECNVDMIKWRYKIIMTPSAIKLEWGSNFIEWQHLRPDLPACTCGCIFSSAIVR